MASVTIPLSVYERAESVLCLESHKKAVRALREKGICIIKGLFSKDHVTHLGKQSLLDFQSAVDILREKGIDLEKPGEDGPMINNFHELSMREALRCDLRNGKHMKSSTMREHKHEIFSTLSYSPSAYSPLPSNLKNNENLREHPSVLRMLREAMHKPGEHELGNWGLWNFEGPGPQRDTPPPIKAGKS